MSVSFENIVNAAKTLGDQLERTPCRRSRTLSALTGAEVWLKFENHQFTASFKERGALNKLRSLNAEQRQRGVIAMSAGNHAQGVAFHASRLGIPATIVMPANTPFNKVQQTRTHGARVVLHGAQLTDAEQHAHEIAKAEHLVFVHPYDDADIIAGQGTIAMEIVRQHPGPIHAIFVAIGGGGLIAGIAAYVKRLRPEIKVIGVQPVDSDAMYQSIKAGRRVKLAQVGLFADGVAVKQVGKETFRLCRTLVDEIVRVDTDAMCAAIKDVFEDTRAILEPAGALAIAGAKAWAARRKVRNATLVAVACGANMNFDRLRFVAEEAELGEHREAILAVTIPEKPGSFKTFCELLGPRNVTEFNYRFDDPQKARVFVGVQVRNRQETEQLVKTLRRKGLQTLDLSDNELAKLHVRHMVGGHAPGAKNEILYRFEFPEKPGALMRFLTSMSRGWNISLFHYRNHGADYGRVLVGMEVPPADKAKFKAFLAEVGYPCADESQNPAYRLFLS